MVDSGHGKRDSLKYELWHEYRRQSGKGAAYIKISETEIANDYPEPAQYQKVTLHSPVCCRALTRLFRLTPCFQPQR